MVHSTLMITEGKLPKKKYPYLGIYENETFKCKTIVLFIEKNTGIRLYSSIGSEIGEISANYSESLYSEYEGQVILSNI